MLLVIPKTLFFTYIQSDLPERYRLNLEKWKEMYPDWEVRFFSDADILRFFEKHFPEYAGDLAKVTCGPVLADVFRYGALYIYGGMYTDMDTVPLGRVPDEWLSQACVIGYENQKARTLCQWTLLSKPQHPLFRRALEGAFQNLRAVDFRIQRMSHVLELSGPLLLTSLASQFSDLLILDGDYFGAHPEQNRPFTSRSLVHHQFEGLHGWALNFVLPQVRLNRKTGQKR